MNPVCGSSSRRRAWRGRGGVRLVGASALVAAAVLAAACGEAARTARGAFDPRTEGQLLVAADLPAPGFWRGEAAGALDGGFEWALAHRLAERFDLDVGFVDVPLADILAGDLHGADVALAQVTATDDREDQLRFSAPYLDSSPAVLAPTEGDGDDIVDLATARARRWAVVAGTPVAGFLDDTVQPDADTRRVGDATAAAAAVAAGRVDAALVELPTALLLAGGTDDLAVVARFDALTGIAAALPEDGPAGNVAAVDKALAALGADGTLDDLHDRWLSPAYATDPGDVSVIRTR